MKLRKYIIAIAIAALATNSFAQYSNTLYFMDEISERNAMNPAFLPRCQSYFDFILLPNFYIGAGENYMMLKDLNNMDALTERLKNGNDGMINTNAHINLLNFGVSAGLDQYFIFESGINIDQVSTVPRDIFRFALEGMPDPDARYSYDLTNLDVDLNAYAYAGIGYSGRLSRHTTFGIKAKALFGLANARSNIYNLQLQASRENWTLYSQSAVDVATCMPYTYSLNENGKIDFKTLKFSNNIADFRPAGYGAAFDLGITIEPVENLVISAAVTDLGAIYWNKSALNRLSLNTNVVYDGIVDYSIGDTAAMGSQAEEKLKSLGDQVMDSISISSTESYHSMIYAKFNAGIEYGILKNKISFGVMNRLTFNNRRLYDEVTLAVNFRPCEWFKAALSYSFLNGNWGTLGLGLNLNLAAVNMYLIADYVPITWATVYSEEQNINMSLPDRLNHFNIQAGMAFNLHRFDRDNDRDGVSNNYDYCPDQDIEYLRKKYPKKKLKELRSADGCIKDEDKDGVSDFEDLCPGTPTNAKVDSVGCPIDSDHDSVPDYMDMCPETPKGVTVDSLGCPIDTDKDGVADYLDKCPETPANVTVDKDGCPVDTDGDGVPDYLDKCMNTPKNVIVDENGCPVDSDNDGVADYLDKCQDTPAGVKVNANGCPQDTDGDNVPDYLDQCPEVAGPADNNGCPKKAPEEVHNIFKKAMQGIQFETAKAKIKKSSYPILDKIVAELERDTTYKLEISGHTDAQGEHDKNVQLSQDRAQAVVDYLISKGINSERLTAVGYGPDRPIADNSTSEGRKTNRRVEFEIIYETVTYKE